MQDTTRIERKHYIIGGLIIALAFILQPFSLIMVQSVLAPRIAPLVTGQNSDGSVTVEGREINTEDLKIRGNNQASIYLVEFSDYECPFCSRFHSTPKDIVANSNGKVAWVWKYFPLTQIHPNAHPSSVAAECVYRLGGAEKFWQFSDTLIAKQTSLNENLYKSEATKLGIPAGQFTTCLNDATVAAEVDKNTQEGESLGVTGTPTTFVVKNENGKLTILEAISGALPRETVDSIVAKYSN
jgi:protein-disulfide isomerase